MAEVNVTVLTPRKILFSGKAKSIILPGEGGEFEVLPFHKSILSRLVAGTLFIDDEGIDIKRGAIKVHQNIATIIIEQQGEDTP